jgi:hypothetical protein
VKSVKQRVKPVSGGKIQANRCVNPGDVCIRSTMVGVSTDNLGVHYSMVETKTLDGRKLGQ